MHHHRVIYYTYIRCTFRAMSDFPRSSSRERILATCWLIYAAHAAPRYPTHVSGMTVQVVEIQAWYFVSRPSVNIARPRKICEITSQPCHGWMGYGITSNSGRDIFQDEEDSSLRDGRFLFYFFRLRQQCYRRNMDIISLIFHLILCTLFNELLEFLY